MNLPLQDCVDHGKWMRNASASLFYHEFYFKAIKAFENTPAVRQIIWINLKKKFQINESMLSQSAFIKFIAYQEGG